MNKILRLTFVAVLAAMSSLSFAQKTVTFKSSEMTGEKGTDITLVKDGVTLTFSNADLTFHYSLFLSYIQVLDFNCYLGECEYYKGYITL